MGYDQTVTYEPNVVIVVRESDLVPTWCKGCGDWVMRWRTSSGDVHVVVDESQSTPETMVLSEHRCQGPKEILPFRREVRHG